MGDENHAEAKKLADVLLQSPSPADRLAASLVYGRILLATGQKEPARQYLAGMKKLVTQAFQPDAANAAQLMEVYAAWLAFLDGREDDGVKALEQMLIDKKPGSATAEAADVLAILYLKRQDRAAARRAVDFGLAFIKYENAGRPSLPSPAGRGAGGEGSRQPAPHSPDSRDSRAQSKSALQSARSEALPYWLALIEKFPQSRHLPEALCHADVLFSESSPKHDAEKSAAHFERLVKEFPKSPWTGDAHVCLIDVCLEQRFDLAAAEKHAQAAVKWLAEQGAGSQLSAVSGPLSVASGDKQLTTDNGQLTTYAIFLRAGLIEYLQERCPKAVEWFEKAKPFAPPRDFVVVHGTIPTGIEKLIELAKSGKYITPEEARQGDPTAKLVLMLADVYHEGEEWQKSLDLCTRVIDPKGFKPTSPQKSWAHFKRGRNYYCFDGDARDPDAAQSDYLAAVQALPKADWASKALFLAANIHWNHFQDREVALRLWDSLARLSRER